jgi:hypothetical protein
MQNIIVGCSTTAGWRMNLKCTKWLKYQEEIIIKTIILTTFFSPEYWKLFARRGEACE